MKKSLKNGVIWFIKWGIIIGAIIMGVMYTGNYVTEQLDQKQALENLTKVQDAKIKELGERKDISNLELKEGMVAEMLAKLSKEEWGNYTEGDGKLRYANDPQKKRYNECRRIGGARNINCDSWTIYQWKIPTAQMFYKKIYGVDLTQKDMLKFLLDDDQLKNFTARAIIENKSAIWHWSTANNSKDYYNVVIDTIRKLEK